MTRKPIDRRARNQGMNWIRPEKRLAIYLRDGLACAYCGVGIETDGVRLTLDHVKPHSTGGNTDAANLVTACGRCNSARGARHVSTFAKTVAAYLDHGVKATTITAHVHETRRRPINVILAKAIITRRGGFTAALTTLTTTRK